MPRSVFQLIKCDHCHTSRPTAASRRAPSMSREPADAANYEGGLQISARPRRLSHHLDNLANSVVAKTGHGSAAGMQSKHRWPLFACSRPCLLPVRMVWMPQSALEVYSKCTTAMRLVCPVMTRVHFRSRSTHSYARLALLAPLMLLHTVLTDLRRASLVPVWLRCVRRVFDRLSRFVLCACL